MKLFPRPITNHYLNTIDNFLAFPPPKRLHGKSYPSSIQTWIYSSLIITRQKSNILAEVTKLGFRGNYCQVMISSGIFQDPILYWTVKWRGWPTARYSRVRNFVWNHARFGGLTKLANGSISQRHFILCT